jgi:hypothetical protein
VDRETARLIRKIRRIARTTPLHGPVRLSQRYLRAVRRVEELAINQAGADKSWVERLARECRRQWRTARPAR